MLFNKNEERANERVLYKTKPNMVLGCRKAIYGVVLLAIVFVVSPMVIQFIGEMQVYLISHIKLSLTRYAAIAFFAVIFFIIIYIIWQLLKWNSLEYTLTDTRVIIKSGVLSTKKNYMPYRTIQDINTSQGIIARLLNVGTVSAFSAYDNNQISLENISNPSEVEDIIFSNMMSYRDFPEPPRNYVNRPHRAMGRNNFEERYPENMGEDNYYDEYEPITPIGHERNSVPRREYEYYPDEFSFQENSHNKYEYEPYEDDLDYNMDRAMNNSNDGIVYEGVSNDFTNEGHYNEVRDDNSYRNEYRYQNNEPQNYYNVEEDDIPQNEPEQVDEKHDSSETVIRRHFDKFKK